MTQEPKKSLREIIAEMENYADKLTTAGETREAQIIDDWRIDLSYYYEKIMGLGVKRD